MSRPVGLARLVRAVAAAVLVVLAMPSVARADAAGPTDYRTEIVSIDSTGGLGEDELDEIITVSIEGGDSFVRIEVAPGHEVLVLGYEADPGPEPYLRIDAEGTVFQNRLSYATYYNEERYGTDDIPAIVDNAAAPEWEPVGEGGAWSWHDHRAHYMGSDRPINMEPGDSFPTQVVPLVVDGVPVEVEVRTTLQSGPSWVPPAFGALIGLQLVLLASLAGPATTVLAGAVIAALATVVGAGQYLSLPAETGPLMTWWLLPAVAAAGLIATVVVYGRSPLVERSLVALAGLMLALWGFRRRSGLTSAVVPTDLPQWFDRMVSAGALAGGVALAVVAIRDLFRVSPEP